MRSIYTELALHGIKNECARTDTVFLPISEVCDGTVSLGNISEENFQHSLQRSGKIRVIDFFLFYSFTKKKVHSPRSKFGNFFLAYTFS